MFPPLWLVNFAILPPTQKCLPSTKMNWYGSNVKAASPQKKKLDLKHSQCCMNSARLWQCHGNSASTQTSAIWEINFFHKRLWRKAEERGWCLNQSILKVLPDYGTPFWPCATVLKSHVWPTTSVENINMCGLQYAKRWLWEVPPNCWGIERKTHWACWRRLELKQSLTAKRISSSCTVLRVDGFSSSEFYVTSSMASIKKAIKHFRNNF